MLWGEDFCLTTADPTGFETQNTPVTFEASFNHPGSSYMSNRFEPWDRCYKYLWIISTTARYAKTHYVLGPSLGSFFHISLSSLQELRDIETVLDFRFQAPMQKTLQKSQMHSPIPGAYLGLETIWGYGGWNATFSPFARLQSVCLLWDVWYLQTAFARG